MSISTDDSAGRQPLVDTLLQAGIHQLERDCMNPWVVCVCLMLSAPLSWAEPIAEVEGVRLPISVTLNGTKLLLNGAAVRKRGYFKTDVVALYLPNRATTFSEVLKMAGPKRLHVVPLRDLDGSTISRYFLNDFKQVATEPVFKQLINEVGMVGGVYGALHKIYKGDVITIDWLPGVGEQASLNGRQLLSVPITNELMYEISLRISLGPTNPKELQEHLLSAGKEIKISESDTR